ncbi:MAG TPA: extracellular solute-binding protein [Candidatus Blautia faecavium]|mgnify:FL=1|uniref:Extracellular solute-binding protein n=1 Tax=Candidatus Blautia faecavium TaxID=2838487 RepID=A0A9D2RXW0_9FIRM|nr:extracellular solute-binding protein [Candidatus Blautia faecavium]
MKKKIVAVMMSLAMVASLGSGVTVFASDDASTDYDVENREYNDVTITIHTRWDEADVSGPLYQAIVDGFMEEYPGITVECINIPTESEWLNSESVLMSDPASMPNILQEYGGSRVAGYIEQNLIVNMDPYYEQYPEWEERFNSLGTSLVDYSSFGYEGTYGVPFTAYQIELFYNEDILNENGIDPASIKSWDDLMAACETLKANGVQPFEMGEMDDYRFGHLHSMLNYKTYGCEVAEQLGTREMTYDSEEQIAIYNMIKEAVDKGYLGTNLLGNDDGQERSIFNTGGCAFLFMGTWYCAEDHSGLELFENEKIHAMRFPYVNEEYELDDMGGGNEGYYVVDTGDPDEVAASVLFLKYMTREDVVNTFVEGYPIPMSVNVTSDAGNYLVKEANAIIAETEDVRGDIENYDSATHMINTVRQALQGLAMGQTAEEVGQRIVEMIAQYE